MQTIKTPIGRLTAAVSMLLSRFSDNTALTMAEENEIRTHLANAGEEESALADLETRIGKIESMIESSGPGVVESNSSGNPAATLDLIGRITALEQILAEALKSMEGHSEREGDETGKLEFTEEEAAFNAAKSATKPASGTDTPPAPPKDSTGSEKTDTGTSSAA